MCDSLSGETASESRLNPKLTRLTELPGSYRTQPSATPLSCSVCPGQVAQASVSLWRGGFLSNGCFYQITWGLWETVIKIWLVPDM